MTEQIGTPVEIRWSTGDSDSSVGFITKSGIVALTPGQIPLLRYATGLTRDDTLSSDNTYRVLALHATTTIEATASTTVTTET
jgi:hypothetical protein